MPEFVFSVSELTVIIPSLGRPQLNRTIQSIDEWQARPHLVLVVLPPGGTIQLDQIPKTNVAFFRGQKRGQVSQRIEGFKRAQTKFVLQLDDDILLTYSAIEKLGNLILQSRSCCTAPLIRYYNDSPCQQISRNRKRSRFIGKINSLILGNPSISSGFGKVNRAGIPVYLTPSSPVNGVVSVDYASGGVMLHYAHNLVVDNYYPFDGRADYEDIFHCFYLKKNNIEIFVDTDVFGEHDIVLTPFKQSLNNVFFRAFPILRSYNRLVENHNYRLFFWILSIAFLHVAERIKINLIRFGNTTRKST
jgi:hypothetical protein